MDLKNIPDQAMHGGVVVGFGGNSSSRGLYTCSGPVAPAFGCKESEMHTVPEMQCSLLLNRVWRVYVGRSYDQVAMRVHMSLPPCSLLLLYHSHRPCSLINPSPALYSRAFFSTNCPHMYAWASAPLALY